MSATGKQARGEQARLRAREDRNRMAGNATADAEQKPDEIARQGMSPEEKLQARTDELMLRLP